MDLTTEEILDAALALPFTERVEVLEALAHSLEEKDTGVLDDSWKALLRRRSEELASGKVQGVPWSEVKRQAREKMGG